MKRLKRLFQDRLILNFLHILSGDAFASLLSIFSISFITKGIGLEKYGFIVLVQGVVSLIDGLFNFQSWQGVIKFFPEVRDDENRLKSLIKFSYTLDMVTALITFLIILTSSSIIGRFYNFSREEINLLLVFAIYVIFNIQGTAIGILRSYNRFDYLRNQRVIVAIINFALLAGGYILKLEIPYFILVYLFTNLANSLLLNYFAMKELRRRKIFGIMKTKLHFNREFFKFTCLTNINSSLDIPVQYFDNLLVGKMLSLEQLGVYKICKTIAIALDKIGAPLYQTLYPYFCEKIVEKNYGDIFKRCLKISAILGVFCIFILSGMNIIGFSLLEKFFSQGLKNYSLEINIYLFMKSLATVTIIVHPLFLAMGYIKSETKIIFIANMIYLFILFLLIKKLALIGVILAYGIQVLLIVFMKGFVIFEKRDILKVSN